MECKGLFDTNWLGKGTTNQWALGLKPFNNPVKDPQKPLLAGVHLNVPKEPLPQIYGQVPGFIVIPSWNVEKLSDHAPGFGKGCPSPTVFVGVGGSNTLGNVGKSMQGCKCIYPNPTTGTSNTTDPHPQEISTLCDSPGFFDDDLRLPVVTNVCGTLDTFGSCPAPLGFTPTTNIYANVGATYGQGLASCSYKLMGSLEDASLLVNQTSTGDLPTPFSLQPNFTQDFKDGMVQRIIFDVVLQAWGYELYEADLSLPPQMPPRDPLYPTLKPFSLTSDLDFLRDSIVNDARVARSVPAARYPNLPKDLDAIKQCMILPEFVYDATKTGDDRFIVYLPVPALFHQSVAGSTTSNLTGEQATQFLGAIICENRTGGISGNPAQLKPSQNTFPAILKTFPGSPSYEQTPNLVFVDLASQTVINNNRAAFTKTSQTMETYVANHPGARPYAVSRVFQCPVARWSPTLLYYFKMQNVNMPWGDSEFCCRLSREMEYTSSDCLGRGLGCSNMTGSTSCSPTESCIQVASAACSAPFPRMASPEVGHNYELVLSQGADNPVCECLNSNVTPVLAMGQEQAGRCFATACTSNQDHVAEALGLSAQTCGNLCPIVSAWLTDNPSPLAPVINAEGRAEMDFAAFRRICGGTNPDVPTYNWGASLSFMAGGAVLVGILGTWLPVGVPVLIGATVVALALAVFAGVLFAGIPSCDYAHKKTICKSPIGGFEIPNLFCREQLCKCDPFLNTGCEPGESCTQGQCGPCVPNCAQAVCGGGDGCGGTCNNCPTGQCCHLDVSREGTTGCVPRCLGGACKPDGFCPPDPLEPPLISMAQQDFF